MVRGHDTALGAVMVTIVKTIHRTMPYLVDDAIAKSLRRRVTRKQALEIYARIRGLTKADLQKQYEETVAINKRHGISPKEWSAKHGPIRRAVRNIRQKSRAKVTLPTIKIQDDAA